MPSLFARFGSRGRHRQVSPQDQIEILKMELDYVRKIAAGRKELIRKLGEDNAGLRKAEQFQASRIRELEASNRSLMGRLALTGSVPADVPRFDPSASTQEIRLATADPIAVDVADHLHPQVNSRDLVKFGLAANSTPVQPVLPAQRRDQDAEGCDR